VLLALRVPKHVARIEKLAGEFGVSLSKSGVE
jgi:hypothetical protein